MSNPICRRVATDTVPGEALEVGFMAEEALEVGFMVEEALEVGFMAEEVLEVGFMENSLWRSLSNCISPME